MAESDGWKEEGGRGIPGQDADRGLVPCVYMTFNRTYMVDRNWYVVKSYEYVVIVGETVEMSCC